MKKIVWLMLLISGITFATEIKIKESKTDNKIGEVLKKQTEIFFKTINKNVKKILDETKKKSAQEKIKITEKEKQKLSDIKSGEIDKEIIATPDIILKK